MSSTSCPKRWQDSQKMRSMKMPARRPGILDSQHASRQLARDTQMKRSMKCLRGGLMSPTARGCLVHWNKASEEAWCPRQRPSSRKSQKIRSMKGQRGGLVSPTMGSRRRDSQKKCQRGGLVSPTNTWCLKNGSMQSPRGGIVSSTEHVAAQIRRRIAL